MDKVLVPVKERMVMVITTKGDNAVFTSSKTKWPDLKNEILNNCNLTNFSNLEVRIVKEGQKVKDFKIENDQTEFAFEDLLFSINPARLKGASLYWDLRNEIKQKCDSSNVLKQVVKDQFGNYTQLSTNKLQEVVDYLNSFTENPLVEDNLIEELPDPTLEERVARLEDIVSEFFLNTSNSFLQAIDEDEAYSIIKKVERTRNT